MENGDRSKSCQQDNSSYGSATIWNSFAFSISKRMDSYVTDLKDCFFTIPLQEKNREKFAFTVTTYNSSQPTRRYQQTVLPKGMLNSPTLCQYFLSQPLEIIWKQFPKSIIYHYMDDILLSDSNKDTLESMFEEVKKVLPRQGLQIASEKIQRGDSINYLGYRIGLEKI